MNEPADKPFDEIDVNELSVWSPDHGIDLCCVSFYPGKDNFLKDDMVDTHEITRNIHLENMSRIPVVVSHAAQVVVKPPYPVRSPLAYPA